MKNKLITTITILLAAILFCAACGRNSASATSIRLMKKEGKVRVEDSKGKSLSPEENMGLYDGYSMETRQESYAWINLDSVKLTKMDSDSEIEIRKDGKRLEIQVDSGSLYFNVTEPLEEDESLDIRTSTMAVGIRGTCGWVSVTDKSHMTVCILEGTVECSVKESSGERKTVSVSGGEMAELWLSEDGTAAITVMPFAESDILPFVLEELAEDDMLCRKVQDASGLDIPAFLGTWEGENSGSDGSVTDNLLSEEPAAGLQGDDSSEELAPMPEDHVMDWQDDALEEAMRGITDIYDRDIMLSDVWEMDNLHLDSRNITNIDALGELVNLKELLLGSNQLKDISALKDLTKLNYLALHDNEIDDISVLGNLMNLESIALSDNQISDIAVLGNMIQLKSLQLTDNQISNIGALQSLSNLTYLSLEGNQISDINALVNLTSLEYLDLGSNQISDISALRNLTRLEYLNLKNNQISDISALENLTNLTTLWLNVNHQLSDISALEHLTNLTMLGLDRTAISDISVLRNLTNLEHIDLHSNQISDISPLENLTSLISIDLKSNQINDVSALKNLINLQHLYLQNNEISDVSALSGLSNLESLWLKNNPISDYSPVEFVPNLNTTY